MKFLNLKRFKMVLIVFLINSAIVNAQDMSISALGGYVPDGFGFLGTFEYSKGRADFIQASILFTVTQDRSNDLYEIPYNISTLNIGYFRKIIQTRNTFFKLSAGGGAVGGYEFINNGDEALDDGALLTSESGFIYGFFGGLDAEIYISDNMSFLAIANEYYHINSNLGKFTFFGGVGLRFFIN